MRSLCRTGPAGQQSVYIYRHNYGRDICICGCICGIGARLRMPRRGRSRWRWRRCLPPPPVTRSCSDCTCTPRPQPAPCLLRAHVPAAASKVTLPAESRPSSGQAMDIETAALSPCDMNHRYDTLQLVCLPRSLCHLAQSYACNHSISEGIRDEIEEYHLPTSGTGDALTGGLIRTVAPG